MKHLGLREIFMWKVRSSEECLADISEKLETLKRIDEIFNGNRPHQSFKLLEPFIHHLIGRETIGAKAVKRLLEIKEPTGQDYVTCYLIITSTSVEKLTKKVSFLTRKKFKEFLDSKYDFTMVIPWKLTNLIENKALTRFYIEDVKSEGS